MTSVKRRAIISLVASYVSQLGQTGANFVIKILLARLISPTDWGVYAEAMMVVLVTDTLTDAGLSQHVVREKHRPYGNVLLIRLLLGTAGTLAMVLAAPLLAAMFNTQALIGPVRGLAPLVMIRVLSSVPRVYLDRELMVHKALGPQMLGIAAMALISLPLAHAGFAAWALIIGTLCSELIQTILMWMAVRKTIPLELTLAYTKHLLQGSKFLFLIAVVGFAMQQGHVAITGSLLSPHEVGIFAMAFTIVTLVAQVVETAIYRVIYPLFCEYANAGKKLTGIYQCATIVMLAIEAPIYFYLLFNARFIVGLLLSPKWLPMAPILAALAPTQITNKFTTFGIEVLRALKSDRWLTLVSVLSAGGIVIFGFILTRIYGLMGMVAAYYFTIGSIVMLVALYRVMGRDFIRLLWKMGAIYVISFLLALAPMILRHNAATASSLIAMAIVPFSWLIFYRLYWNSVAKPTLDDLD